MYVDNLYFLILFCALKPREKVERKGEEKEKRSEEKERDENKKYKEKTMHFREVLAPVFFADPGGAVVGKNMDRYLPQYNRRWSALGLLPKEGAAGKKTVCGSAAVLVLTSPRARCRSHCCTSVLLQMMSRGGESK